MTKVFDYGPEFAKKNNQCIKHCFCLSFGLKVQQSNLCHNCIIEQTHSTTKKVWNWIGNWSCHWPVSNCWCYYKVSYQAAVPTKICTHLSHTSGSLVAGAEHRFMSLEDISTWVKEEFGELLKKCSAEVTDLCRQEKQAWRKVDDLEEECQKLCQEVKNKTEEVVSSSLLLLWYCMWWEISLVTHLNRFKLIFRLLW